jgi:ubiquinone biosynthesis protein COQ4
MTNARNEQAEADYLKGEKKPLTTESSILISSSRYLNSARMRDVVATEMLRKMGSDLPPAYYIPERSKAFEEVTDYPYILELLERERKEKPEFAAWLDNRQIASMNEENLRDFQPGTLGHEVHCFMCETGFDIDFMFKGDPADDYQYFLKRFVQNHDIMHMVTGLDVTPVGELALIILSMTAYFDYFSPEFAAELSKYNGLSIGAQVNQALLHYPSTTMVVFDAIELGRGMAREMNTPFFYICWEDHLDKSIEELRAEFNILNAPAKGAWDWVKEAMGYETV